MTNSITQWWKQHQFTSRHISTKLGDAPLFLSPPPTDESAEYLAEFRDSFNIGCTAIISDPSTFAYLMWQRLDGM